MSGTSYDNNSFKLISRNNSTQQPAFTSNTKKAANMSHIITKDQSVSPPLQPIEEIVTMRKESKILIGASSTQSKFYIPSQKTTKIVQKGSRNISNNLKQNSEESVNSIMAHQMKSYNITQEKFFPSRSQNSQHQNEPDSKVSTFYNSKAFNVKSECKMSLEFINNGQSQEQQKPQIKQRMKKGNDMIREEQYDEEISEDDCPYRKDVVSTKPRNSNAYGGREAIDENFSQDSQQNHSYLGQTQINIERPTNRLGGSRALNQTKGDWKDTVNEYSNSIPGQSSNAHSLPRSYQNQYAEVIGGDQSAKSTSSAASLTMSKQNIGTNNSSISPKPFKQQAFIGSQVNTSKIQELQKEVNLMYLGGLQQQKKKASAGIKLNPINRGMGGSGFQAEQSYQL